MKKYQNEKHILKIPRRKETEERLAYIVSEITNPLFVALPTFLIIAVATAPTILQGLFWWGVIAVGTSAAPFFFIRRGVRRGRYSDHHVSVREQRLIPLLFGLGCALLVFLCLYLLHASQPLIATITATLVTGAIATVITQFWKISLHLVGIAGTVTVFWLLFGPLFLVLSPLVVIVAWARWRVCAHTPLQAAAGTVLAVGMTILTFWLFGIH